MIVFLILTYAFACDIEQKHNLSDSNNNEQKNQTNKENSIFKTIQKNMPWICFYLVSFAISLLTIINDPKSDFFILTTCATFFLGITNFIINKNKNLTKFTIHLMPIFFLIFLWKLRAMQKDKLNNLITKLTNLFQINKKQLKKIHELNDQITQLEKLCIREEINNHKTFQKKQNKQLEESSKNFYAIFRKK